MKSLKQDALDYHRTGRKGKIEVVASKPCRTQADLSLAYKPGVAEPCREIARSPELSFEYTARSIGMVARDDALKFTVFVASDIRHAVRRRMIPPTTVYFPSRCALVSHLVASPS
jgi:malic enzyme